MNANPKPQTLNRINRVQGAFCETTIGYRVKANGLILQEVFNDPLFHVSIVNDVPGVEVSETKHQTLYARRKFKIGCRSRRSPRVESLLGPSCLFRTLKPGMPSIPDPETRYAVYSGP
jgi:hypothetical protein